MTAEDFLFVPFEEASTPPSGLINHIKDRWWAVHPEKGVLFYITRNSAGREIMRSPQCNADKRIIEPLLEKNYSFLGPLEVRQIPSVFHRIRPEDYA